MQLPFFAMQNNHLKTSGEPPVFRNGDSRRYYGYFENELGEQWVFAYDRERKKGELCGGDIGWQMVIPVVDGVPIGVNLREDEERWLKACWFTASGQRTGLRPV